MKKRIPIFLSSLLFLGCSSNHHIDDTPETTIKTEDVFYHALLGNLMEASGQTNNAIAHYEELLTDSYDPNVIKKLLPLYSEKNDYVGIKSILSKTTYSDIQSSFNEYIISYYLINNKENSAINYILSELNNLKYVNKDFDSFYKNRVSFYKTINEQLKIAYQKNEKNKKNNFLKLLKTKDFKYYNMYEYLNDFIVDKKYNTNLLHKNDFLIYKYNNYIQNPSLNDLEHLIKNKISFDLISNETNDLFYSLLEEKEYKEIKNLYNLFNSNNIKNNTINYYNFIASFSLFENKDALYILQQLKPDLDVSLFNYYSGLLNYRLGYHKASKRYFENIDNIDLIKSISSLYINVVGINNLQFLKDNISTAEYYSLLLNYYIDLKDIKNSNIIKQKLKTSGIDNENILYLNLINDYLNNDVNLLTKVKKLYEDNKLDPVIVNLYAYILTDSNENPQLAYNLMSTLKDLKEPAFLDTLAYSLIKLNRFNEALNIYKTNNLIYNNNEHIQSNLIIIYNKLNNKKESERHIDIYNQIKLDK